MPGSSTEAREEQGVIDASDVVVSGCGRVYAFPPSTPQSARAAGFNRFPHRVGYVEKSGMKWLARNFGNVPLGEPRWRRVDAVKAVLSDAGLRVRGILPSENLAPISMQVLQKEAARPKPAKVVISGDGRVFVALERASKTRARNLHWVGFVWRSQNYVVALGQDEESTMCSSHRSLTDAVRRLISDAGYVRLASASA